MNMGIEWRSIFVPINDSEKARLDAEWEKMLADIDYWVDTHSPAETGYAGGMHLGTGMSRLAALSVLLNRSSLAGREFEPTIVRNNAGDEAVAIHLAADAHAALEGAALHTDRVAAAVATVTAQIEAGIAQLKCDVKEDEPDHRPLTAARLNAIGENFVGEVIAAMKKLDTQTAIPDLVRLQKKLIERLEASATAAQKHIKGALT
ncbi:MAG: hypothetical protein OXI83_13365, partial [Gemmatimonadota bacterium]|nr:hypothetical protein [Gemmatimonadota bacterium]